MVKDGYFKVSESGGSFITAGFYNPVTNDYYSCVVRDYDYADGSRDNDELYYMPINEDARRAWKHANGEILVNDTVMVFKGRKVPVGTVGTVKDIRPYRDHYGRIQAYYAYLDNGCKTNVDNCVLVIDTTPK